MTTVLCKTAFHVSAAGGRESTTASVLHLVCQMAACPDLFLQIYFVSVLFLVCFVLF